MFCGNCGAQNPDDAMFCKSCGSPLQAAPPSGGYTQYGGPEQGTSYYDPSQGGQYSDPAQSGQYYGQSQAGQYYAQAATASAAQVNRRHRIIGIAAVAIAVIAVFFLLSSLFGGRSYKSTVTQFLDASFDGDARAIFELLPDDLIDYMTDEMGYDREQITDELDGLSSQLQWMLSSLSSYLGDDWDLSYQVVGAEDLSGSDLRDIQDTYDSYDVDVKAAKNVEVELSIQAGNLDETQTIQVPVIKVGRSWCLDIDNLSGVF